MIIVDSDEVTGTVVLRDQREDGSYVYLLCQSMHPGSVFHPDPPEIFPTGFMPEAILREAERAEKRAFALEVDIGRMPQGELRFHQVAFLEKAIKESEAFGKTEITPETASEWGYVGRPSAEGPI